MKNIRIFIRKLSFFGGEIFNIFEQACFRNELVPGCVCNLVKYISVILRVLVKPEKSKIFGNIIGIKHIFSCINIRQVPREVLKTETGGRSFQHLPRALANVNLLKNHDRSLLLHKSENICYISRYFLHYFVSPFH